MSHGQNSTEWHYIGIIGDSDLRATRHNFGSVDLGSWYMSCSQC